MVSLQNEKLSLLFAFDFDFDFDFTPNKGHFNLSKLAFFVVSTLIAALGFYFNSIATQFIIHLCRVFQEYSNFISKDKQLPFQWPGVLRLTL